MPEIAIAYPQSGITSTDAMQPDARMPAGLPVPRPQQYPPGQDEASQYQQYYRGFWRTKPFDLSDWIATNPGVGTRAIAQAGQPGVGASRSSQITFRAVIVDNESGFTLLMQIGEHRIWIPPTCTNFVRVLPESPMDINITIFATGAVGQCMLVFTEEPLSPCPGIGVAGGGGGGPITAPLGAATAVGAAVSVVLIPSNTQAVVQTGALPAGANNIGSVNVASPLGVQAAGASLAELQGLGATNVNSAQVASSGVAATLAIARATRVGLKIRNLDATNGIWYGPATVTAGNGNFLAAGQETVVTWVGLVQVLAAAGTPTVAIWDEYY